MINYIVGVIIALLGTTAGIITLTDTSLKESRIQNKPTIDRLFLDETSVTEDSTEEIERDISTIKIQEYDFDLASDTDSSEREYRDEDEEEDDEEEHGRVSTTPKTTPVTVAPKPPTSVATTRAGITRAELSVHNNANNCWIVFDGAVYDITPIIDWHPGGPDVLITYCGDSEKFTQAFKNKHGLKQVNNLVRRALSKGTFTN